MTGGSELPAVSQYAKMSVWIQTSVRLSGLGIAYSVFTLHLSLPLCPTVVGNGYIKLLIVRRHICLHLTLIGVSDEKGGGNKTEWLGPLRL